MRTLLTALIVLTAWSAQGAVRYVDFATGNDANVGTSTAAQLCDTGPSVPSNYSVNVVNVDSKHFTDVTRRNSAGFEKPDLNNVLVGKFGLRQISSKFNAILSQRIVNIVALCSKEQVSGIDTRRIVSPRTVVQDANPVWDFLLVCDLPGDTMRKQALSSTLDLSVSMRIFGACPNPTRICLFYASPESLFKPSWPPIETSNRAPTSETPVSSDLIGCEAATASLTKASYFHA